MVSSLREGIGHSTHQKGLRIHRQHLTRLIVANDFGLWLRAWSLSGRTELNHTVNNRFGRSCADCGLMRLFTHNVAVLLMRHGYELAASWRSTGSAFPDQKNAAHLQMKVGRAVTAAGSTPLVSSAVSSFKMVPVPVPHRRKARCVVSSGRRPYRVPQIMIPTSPSEPSAGCRDGDTISTQRSDLLIPAMPARVRFRFPAVARMV